MTTTTRLASTVLLLGLSGVVDVNAALAQRPGTGGYVNPGTAGRPTFSPYLNLLRGGNTTLNYYGLVRPQREFREQDLRLRNELIDRGDYARGRTPLQSRTSQLNQTGHASYFMQDQQGSTKTFVIGLQEFGEQRSSLPAITGSRAGPTGHFSLFGNPGGYYPSR